MVSDASGAQELHLYSLESQSIKQLTDGEGRAKYASWSPDGEQIAFTRETLEAPKKDHDIYLLDLDPARQASHHASLSALRLVDGVFRADRGPRRYVPWLLERLDQRSFRRRL